MYKLNNSLITGQPCSVNRSNSDGSMTTIPLDPANTDYQAYLKWLEEGNEPLPAGTE